jgi:hypothetical protein
MRRYRSIDAGLMARRSKKSKRRAPRGRFHEHAPGYPASAGKASKNYLCNGRRLVVFRRPPRLIFAFEVRRKPHQAALADA